MSCLSQSSVLLARRTLRRRLSTTAKNGEKKQGPINKTASRMKPTYSDDVIQATKEPSSHNAFSSSSLPSSHTPTHFVKGGTPCDPACPPFHLADHGEDSLYTLILLRHGESEWNSQNRYTGWCDVNLTKQGQREARTAGRLLYENGIELDHAFTSVLKRASFSTNMALNMAYQHWVPVTKTWRLNERHYGALQGYNKDTAYKELGIDQELVMQMRRSYDTRPPRMDDDHPFWHGNDRRYKKLSSEQLECSRAESLKDCAERIMPFFNSVIVPSLQSGNKCIIVSHANTIRTLIKNIDDISDEDIKGMSIPTGIPLLYRLDKDLKPVDPKYELEFRYMVEPKGYVKFKSIPYIGIAAFDALFLSCVLHSCIVTATLGAHLDSTDSLECTWETLKGYKKFNKSATLPIAIGSESFYATLLQTWQRKRAKRHQLPASTSRRPSLRLDNFGGRFIPACRARVTGTCCCWCECENTWKC